MTEPPIHRPDVGADPRWPTAAPATSMPAYAPLYTVGTERVPVRWLTITYPTHPELIEQLLPPPLRPDPEPDVAIWIAEFIQARFTSPDGSVESRPVYRQGGVSVRCRHHRTAGAYAVATFVEGLNHGILGREQFGLPKKQARSVRLDESGGGRQLDAGITTALGIDLLTASVSLDSSRIAAGPAPSWFDSHFTLKLIPSAEGHGFDISRLVEIPWGFQEIGQVQGGSATVTWTSNDADPLYVLSPIAPARAQYGAAVLSLEFGRYREHVTDIRTFGTPAWS